MCSICQRTTKINYFLGLKKEISSSSASLFSRIEVSCSHIIDECTILSAPCAFVAYVLLMPYMPHVPKYFTCSRACVPSYLCLLYPFLFLRALRAFIFVRGLCALIFYVPYVTSFFLSCLHLFTCFSCLHFFKCFQFGCAFHAFTFFVSFRTTHNQPKKTGISKNKNFVF